MDKLGPVIRHSGLLDALYPAETVRHDAAIRRAVDGAGRHAPDVAAAVKTPQVLHPVPGGAAAALAQSGVPVLARVRCGTAPSTGSAVIVVSWESEEQGLTELARVTVTNGSRFGEALPAVVTLPAGAWVEAVVDTANGAAAISCAVTVKGSA